VRRTMILAAVCSLGALLVLLFLLPTSNREVKAAPPPAFQSGGLKIGSGGQAQSDPYSAASPFAPSPSEASTLQGVVYHKGDYPSASTCGRCHVAIHDNWQSSLHRLSASDAWYLKTKDLLAFEQGAPAVRQCAGCHAPVSLMTGEVGLYSSEAASIREGVTCSFCHTLEAVKGGNAKYVSDPGRIRAYPQGDYLAESGIQPAAHLVMASPGQHRTDMLKPFYRTSQFCQGCHELTLNKVKLQSTFSEWAASSYAQKGVTCQGCHFTPGAGPTSETGRLVEHYPNTREGILRHTLGGGSVTVGVRDNRAELRDALKLSARLERGQLQVMVRNVLAGHAVPTGVSDLRELWLEVTAQDVGGHEVFRSGHLDAAGNIQSGSQIFHQVLGDEHGQPLTRHDIWRARSMLSDTRIPADGERKVAYKLPATARRVSVRLLWRDAAQEFQTTVVQGATRSAAVLELAEWKQAE
jgi:Cytochrome c554 and c-prime